MVRWLKIIAIVIASILLIILGIFLSRNLILKYFFEKAVSSQTDGKVTLSIDKINFTLLDGTIVLYKPDLKFNDIYVDSAKTLKLDHIGFDSIYFSHIQFRELLREEKLFADRLLVEKPVISFDEKNSRDLTSFKPDALLHLINKKPKKESSTEVRIRDIEIHYGSVELQRDSSAEEHRELIDFTIKLKNFDTKAAPSVKEEQLLYSDDVLLEIKNINDFYISGYFLDLSSALLSLKEKKIEIIDAKVIPAWFDDISRSRISLDAGKIALHGINLKKMMQENDLDLQSIQISDGYFGYYLPSDLKVKNDTAHNQGIADLSNLLKAIELDSFSIKRFGFFDIRDQYDTLTSVEDINFTFFGLQLDTAFFADPFRRFEVEKLLTRTGPVMVKIPDKELTVSYDKLRYSSDDSLLAFDGLKLISDDTTSGNELNIGIRKLSIDGVHAGAMQKNEHLHLSLYIEQPEVLLDLNNKLFAKSGGSKGFILPEIINLDHIELKEAKAVVTKGDSTYINVNGFSIGLNDLRLPKDTTERLGFKNLSVNLESFHARFLGKDILLDGGQLAFESNQLLMSNVRSTIRSSETNRAQSFRIGTLTVSDFEPLLFVNEKKFSSSGIELRNARVKATLKSNESGSKEKTDPRAKLFEMEIPYTINLDNLDLINLKLDLALQSELKEESVSATINTHVSNINIDKSIDTSFIEQLEAYLSIQDIEANFANQSVKIDKLQIGGPESVLNISGINAKTSHDSLTPFYIQNFHLDELAVNGIDYPQLFLHDSISFQHLFVKELNSDIEVFSKPKKQTDTVHQPINKEQIRSYFDFHYETINFEGFHVNIGVEDKHSKSYFNLNNLHLAHTKNQPEKDNLFEKVRLSFNHFIYTDSTKNAYFKLTNARNDPLKKQLIFENIDFGNLYQEMNNQYIYDSADLRVQTASIIFDNIFIKEGLPSSISVDKLLFEDIDLKVTNKSAQDTSSTPGRMAINLEILKQYSELMSQIKIDTTAVNDITIRYNSIKDNQTKTIRFDSIGLVINNIDIDSSALSKEEPEVIRKITLDLRGRTTITHDSLYSFKTGLISYDFPNRTIRIKDIELKPRFEETAFFEKAVYQTDRMTVSGEEVVLREFKYEELLANNHIEFGSVDLRNIDISIRRDLRYPIKEGIFKKMPQQSLHDMKQKITVDSVHVYNSKLHYGEYTDKSLLPGDVFFDHFNVKAYNLTNDLENIDTATTLRVILDAKIMGEARLDAEINYPLMSSSNDWWMNASSEELDMTLLNSLTENVIGVAITDGKGRLEKSFITGNEINSTGILTFKYKKLKLKLYDRKHADISHKFFAPLLNGMINSLFLKSNNPKFARKAREGQVYFARDTRKSILNYTWKSILSGMMSTMGINNKEQRQERRENKK